VDTLSQALPSSKEEVLLTARAPSMLYDDRSGLKDSEDLFDKLAIPMPNLK
jgi:hypothetical protein